jgi:hypothetical protein
LEQVEPDQAVPPGTAEVDISTVQVLACACADQNERDHQQLVQAIASGRLVAETGM